MRLPVVSPDKFAEWFSLKVLGAYRKVTAEDVKLMQQVGLICKYGYYIRADLETVRSVLQYEQIRNERSEKACLKDAPRICKRCGKSLPENEVRKGRPKEYCPDCESFRGRERYREWRKMQMVPL